MPLRRTGKLIYHPKCRYVENLPFFIAATQEFYYIFGHCEGDLSLEACFVKDSNSVL